MSITHITSFLWVMDACFSLRSKKIQVRNRMHKSRHHSGEPGRDGQARDRYCTFRLSESEAAELAEHAGASSRSVSQLVRLRVLGQPPPLAAAPAANREMYSALARTAANFNQFVHCLNEARGRGEHPVLAIKEAIDLVSEVDKNLSALRADLIGAQCAAQK